MFSGLVGEGESGVLDYPDNVQSGSSQSSPDRRTFVGLVVGQANSWSNSEGHGIVEAVTTVDLAWDGRVTDPDGKELVERRRFCVERVDKFSHFFDGGCGHWSLSIYILNQPNRVIRH